MINNNNNSYEFSFGQGFVLSQDAVKADSFVKQTHACIFENTLYYFDVKTNKWKNDKNEQAFIEFLQRELINETPTMIQKIYKKIRALAPVSEPQLIFEPTIFLNENLITFENNKVNLKNDDIEKFNIFRINIEADLTNTAELQKAEADIEKLSKLLWPDEQIRKWALSNYATAFMPTCFEKLIYNYGQGQDGKSTITNLLQNILGDLTDSFKLNDSDRFSLSNFEGRLCMIDTDYQPTTPLQIDSLKHKTTNGRIELEQKGKDKKTIYNRTTLITNSNFLPKFNDISNATERRLNIVEFKNSMKTNPNAGWFKKSETEKLLNNKWAQYAFVKKCAEAFAELWDDLKGELKAPISAITILQEVCEDNNQIYDFLKNNAEDKLHQILNGTEINLKELYNDYEFYCAENQIKAKYAFKNFKKSIEIVLMNKFAITTETSIKKSGNDRKYFMKKLGAQNE